MITIAINRKSSTGEFTVTHTQNGRLLHPRTAYTEDLEEAVYNATNELERYWERGEEAQLSEAQYTTKAIARYRPEWLLKEPRKAAQSAFSRPGVDVRTSPPNWGSQFIHYGEQGEQTIKDYPPERQVSLGM